MKKKYLVLAAGAAFQLCLGFAYAWGVYIYEYIRVYGGSAGSWQSVYLVHSTFQVIFFLIGGRLLDKKGPRFTGFLSGVFYGSALILNGLLPPSPFSLMLGFGVLGGMGFGFAYFSPIKECQRNFPDKKALVTGLTLAGQGVGGFAIAAAIPCLISLGINIRVVSVILGLVFFLLMSGTSFFFSNETGEERKTENTQDTGIKAVISKKTFWSLFIPMACFLVMTGMIMANLKIMGMGQGISNAVTTAALSIYAISSGAGKAGWGFIAHKTGERKSIIIKFAVQIPVLLLAMCLYGTPAALFLLAVFSGLNIGGSYVLYASAVSKLYGVEKLGTVYSVMFLTSFIGGFGPLIGGRIYDVTKSLYPALGIGVLVCVTGLITFLVVSKNSIAGGK